MKILVTGGAGFIGSNLCEALLKKGNQIVCLDNFSTGKIENILPLLRDYSSNFKLVVGDVCNYDDCSKAIQGVEYVLLFVPLPNCSVRQTSAIAIRRKAPQRE